MESKLVSLKEVVDKAVATYKHRPLSDFYKDVAKAVEYYGAGVIWGDLAAEPPKMIITEDAEVVSIETSTALWANKPTVIK